MTRQSQTVSVPEPVRAKALAAGATEWLAALPSLVADLEREWSITVGRGCEDATEAFVAEAMVGGGVPAVLKLVVPRAGNLATRAEPDPAESRPDNRAAGTDAVTGFRLGRGV